MSSSPLPRGPHHLPRSAVIASQRERMLRAMVDSAAERTYLGASVTDVVHRAGVSRKTFYEQFTNKEACFLVAYQQGWSGLRRHLAEASRRARAASDDPVDWLRASLRAHLSHMADDPAFARAFFIEILAAGPAALAQREEVHAVFANMTQAWHRSAAAVSETFRPVSPDAYRALVGAMHELVLDRLHRGRAAELRELTEPLLALHLTLLADPFGALQPDPGSS